MNFECELCQKPFPILTHLEIHKKGDHGDTKSKCELCENTHERNLKSHMERMHSGKEGEKTPSCHT